MNFYENLIKPFVDYFNDGKFFDNDFAVAGVITAFVSVVLMKIRVVPERIWGRVKRYLFYSVTVEQNDPLYNLICEYLDLHYPNKTRRSLAITKKFVNSNRELLSGEYGKNKGVVYTPLVDSFFVFKLGLYIIKSRDKLDNAKNHDMVYFNKVTIRGIMAKKRIQKLIEDSYALKPKSNNFIKEYKHEQGSYWFLRNECSKNCAVKKSTDSIFFPEKDEILSVVDKFQNSREKYEKACIDWYMGILLHGKAGSGKTVFSRSLAKYTNRDLYTLNISNMRDDEFKNAFSGIEGNAILLLDDVDICLNNRDDKNGNVSLATLLSCLDGNSSIGDLIVVMTTNRISVLDEALTRKGRVDLIKEVSYPDKDSIEDFLKHFYEVDDLEVKDGVIDFSMVEIQHKCLNNESLDDCLKEVNNLIN